ncbi:AEC family transporter [Olsenella massiliensis]|uniref:AEC family transporter n=1 Tax=Olsenella massiliensis TaxID=1622075 RepID=UPI00071D2F3A|nr:AEC family transporter [Olsenella massiliensis]
MFNVLAKVSSFVVVILIGVAAGHSGKFGEGADRLISKIVFNLTLPCAIIRAFGASKFDQSLLCLIALGFAANVTPFFLSLVVYAGKPQDERILQQSNVAGFNIGCFAFAFVQAFFPAQAAIATCLFDAGNSLMCTGGTWALIRALVLDTDYQCMRDKATLFARSLFSSASFDCYVVLIFMGLFDLRIPPEAITLIDPIANANSFLAMFMIGLIIRFTVNKTKAAKLIRLISWRFAFAAVLSLAALFLLPFDPIIRKVVAILAWAPAPSTGPVYTLWAGGDKGLAGMANALTILAGIIMMTSLVLFLGV